MAHIERMLLSRIILTGALTPVVEYGITEEDFTLLTEKQMFLNILGYHEAQATRGSVIGPLLLQAKFPSYEIHDDPAVTLDALCFEVRTGRLRKEAEALAKELVSTGGDPRILLASAQEHIQMLIQLGSSKSVDIDFADELVSMKSKYDDMLQGIFPDVVVPWPWDVLNEETHGVNKTEYCVLYGRPKNGKSWGLSYLISQIFYAEKRALIYTKEMPPADIYRRTAACILGLPYNGLRLGRLVKEDYYEFGRFAEVSETLRNKLICLSGKDVTRGGDTVPWLESKVRHYKPDIVFIDGLYLMSDSSGAKSKKADHQRVADISRAIRQMTLAEGIPCIATMQANRKAALNTQANSDEIAFTDAISQDLTLGMRIIADVSQPRMNWVIGQLAREFQLKGFRTNFKPATDFSFHSLLSEKEIEMAKEQDAAGEERDDPAAHSVVRPVRQPRATGGLNSNFIDKALKG